MLDLYYTRKNTWRIGPAVNGAYTGNSSSQNLRLCVEEGYSK
jgi:hypothetical protein